MPWCGKSMDRKRTLREIAKKCSKCGESLWCVPKFGDEHQRKCKQGGNCRDAVTP